jgi:hypothetical protein
VTSVDREGDGFAVRATSGDARRLPRDARDSTRPASSARRAPAGRSAARPRRIDARDAQPRRARARRCVRRAGCSSSAAAPRPPTCWRTGCACAGPTIGRGSRCARR